MHQFMSINQPHQSETAALRFQFDGAMRNQVAVWYMKGVHPIGLQPNDNSSVALTDEEH